ncbi:MAG: hypothetical protein EOO10_14645 [Chitinophagaceae bacterium]|nr:MAG: hypothetical protein EOO10_14645 [Chitinophagaceae bacterium]
MQLNLCIDDQLLATVPVDPENWKDQKYLNVLTKLLARKNRKAITKLKKQPTFYLQVGSKINLGLN